MATTKSISKPRRWGLNSATSERAAGNRLLTTPRRRTLLCSARPDLRFAVPDSLRVLAVPRDSQPPRRSPSRAAARPGLPRLSPPCAPPHFLGSPTRPTSRGAPLACLSRPLSSSSILSALPSSVAPTSPPPRNESRARGTPLCFVLARILLFSPSDDDFATTPPRAFSAAAVPARRGGTQATQQ